MRRWALITAVGLALAGHARAQAALPLALSWQAPAECAQADAVRAELERITRVRAGVTLAKLSAAAKVERSAQGYATTLRTEREGERGERRLEAGDCRTLVRAVTLVLALAFGAGVELTEGEAPNPNANPNPNPSPNPNPNPNPNPSPSPNPSPNPYPNPTSPALEDTDQEAGPDAPSSGLEAAAIVGAGVALGPLPTPGLALTAGAELVHGALALELRLLALQGLAETLTDDVHGRFDGLGGAALGCGQLPSGSVTLALCAGARAAALRGRSDGASDDSAAIAPFYALAAAGALAWPSSGLVRLRLEAGLSLALGRPRFVIDGLGLAHRVPLLSPELALLLVVAP